MKKILLLLGVAVTLGGAANAQVSYGLRAGVNLGKITNLGSAESNNTSFHVTGYADLPVAPNFSIQPGVSLQGKGSKYEASWGNASNIEVKRNLMSLEVPVNAVYYIPTGYTGSLFLGLGPYIGFNLSGKDKASGDFGGNGVSSERDLEFSGDNKDMKVLDAGINFLGGYKLTNGLLLNVGYGLGLSNLNPNSGDSWKNRVLSFGIGFQI